jgi:hypothetical protein
MTQKPERNRPSSRGLTFDSQKGTLEVPEDLSVPLSAGPQAAIAGVAEGETSSVQPNVGEGGPDSPSKSTWNYRVISFRHGEDA